MGKTKTAIVTDPEKVKSGEEKYKERQKKKAEQQEAEKIRIPGLKGGQRVVAVEAAPTEEQIPQETPTEQKRQIRIHTRGKKYLQARAQVDKNKLYSIPEAIDIVKKTSYSKFNGSVELHLLVKKGGLQTSVELPHSFGKQKKVEVATDETIEKLKTGKIDFDVLLATADMMPKLVPFARLLGPKGMMPNPKAGTLIKSAKDASKFSANNMSVKTEKKAPLVHTIVGKVDQTPKQLQENIEAMLKTIGSKQIVKAYMKASMGPSVKLALA